MSRRVGGRQKIFHTDLGNVSVTTERLVEFDVEDIIRTRSISQGRLVQLINLGKTIDINAPTAPRTIGSVFLNNDEELPE